MVAKNCYISVWSNIIPAAAVILIADAALLIVLPSIPIESTCNAVSVPTLVSSSAYKIFDKLVFVNFVCPPILIDVVVSDKSIFLLNVQASAAESHFIVLSESVESSVTPVSYTHLRAHET